MKADAGVRAVTGIPATRAFAADLAGYAERPDADFPDGYSMNHSGFTYLLDRDAKFVTYFKTGDDPEHIAEGVACHLGA